METFTVGPFICRRKTRSTLRERLQALGSRLAPRIPYKEKGWDRCRRILKDGKQCTRSRVARDYFCAYHSFRVNARNGGILKTKKAVLAALADLDFSGRLEKKNGMYWFVGERWRPTHVYKLNLSRLSWFLTLMFHDEFSEKPLVCMRCMKDIPESQLPGAYGRKHKELDGRQFVCMTCHIAIRTEIRTKKERKGG